MGKLSKLVSNPRQFFTDVHAAQTVQASVRALRTAFSPYRKAYALDVSQGVSQRSIYNALLEATPVFSADSIDRGAGDADVLHCFSENLPGVIHQAGLLADTLCVRLMLGDRRRREAIDRISIWQAVTRARGAPAIMLTFGLDSAPLATITVQVWERREHERVVYCRANNPYARRIPVEAFEDVFDAERKHLSLRKLYPKPIDAECTFDVDVVYTWVDHTDPNWRAMIAQYKDTSEVEWDRYVSIDELRYSLRSLALYAPWVRRIFVVTNCRAPGWFKPSDKIEFVPHEAVFKRAQQWLPTFSSHAIESCLMHVPGLSEHFVYFNDDVFLGMPATKADFFTSNGCSVSYLEPYGMVTGEPAQVLPDYMNAAINGRKLIESTFARSPTRLHLHVPHALKRSVMLEMEASYPEDFARVRGSRFRSMTDISSVSFLYHQFAYQRMQSVRGDCTSVLIKGARYKKEFEQLLGDHNVQFFCINDGDDSATNQDYLTRKSRFLTTYFPTKAQWER